MNPQVTIESQSIKDSLKRNGIGKAIVSVAVLTVVYYCFTSGVISALTMFALCAVYIVLLVFLDYFTAISIMIDRGIFALRKRAIK